MSDVNISAGLQNKLFDHHAIKLELCKRSNPITPPTISKMILKDSETELVGGLAVADTYLIYSTALTVEDGIVFLQVQVPRGENCVMQDPATTLRYQGTEPK